MPLWPLCAAILGRMLDSFPIGQRTAAGDVFWSGTKRVPVALTFSAADPAHLSFVVAAANLRAAAYGLRGRRDSEFHVEALEGLAAEQEHEQEQESKLLVVVMLQIPLMIQQQRIQRLRLSLRSRFGAVSWRRWLV